MKKEKEAKKKGRPPKAKEKVPAGGYMINATTSKEQKKEVVAAPASSVENEAEQPAPKKELSLEIAPAAAQPANEADICASCKATLKDKPKFCPNCGLELNWSVV